MILITGATGFLAGQIACYFKENSNKVKIASSKSKELMPKKLINCDFAHIDLTNHESIEQAVIGSDHILHCAAMDYDSCLKNPVKAREINEEGTRKIVQIAMKNKVKKFVYLSTMHVYGKNLSGIVNESSPLNPDNLYAETHLNSEIIIKDNLKSTDTKYLNLRLSNVISHPIQKKSSCWKLAAQDMCLQAILHRTITLLTDGSQYRDFMTINPLKEVIFEFINSNKSQGTYNLGSGKSLTVLELAHKISIICNEIFDYRPSIKISNKKYSNSYFKLGISKIKRDFNYKSESSIDKAISELLIYCKMNFL